MTITHVPELVEALQVWLKEQALKSNTQNAVVGLSGGIDSAVVFMLCAQTFPKTVGVLMPCHSSEASVFRAGELVRAAPMTNKVATHIVDLEAAFDSIKTQTGLPDLREADAALRSCLRAPTLDFIAKHRNALIYGTGNRDEDAIFRYYQKRGDGAVDNNVLVAFHKSEVRQLAQYLGVPQSIIDAVPSADLWGGEEQTDEAELGITYDEIEWVTRAIEDGDLEFKGISYASLTDRQKYVLDRAHKAEAATRHKAEPPAGTDRGTYATYLD